MVPSRGISAQKRPICAAVDMVPIERKGIIAKRVIAYGVPPLRKRPGAGGRGGPRSVGNHTAGCRKGYNGEDGPLKAIEERIIQGPHGG